MLQQNQELHTPLIMFDLHLSPTILFVQHDLFVNMGLMALKGKVTFLSHSSAT